MRKQSLLTFFFLFISIFLSVQQVYAQDLLKGKDLSQVRVDQLSDADIVKLKTQLTSSGMTIDQAEQAALAKGMPAVEFAKLKKRVEALGTENKEGVGKLRAKTDLNQPSAEKQDNSSDSLDKEKYKEKPPKPLIDPLIFGSELYTTVSPSFEPNMKLATPLNYVLGPDD